MSKQILPKNITPKRSWDASRLNKPSRQLPLRTSHVLADSTSGTQSLSSIRGQKQGTTDPTVHSFIPSFFYSFRLLVCASFTQQISSICLA